MSTILAVWYWFCGILSSHQLLADPIWHHDTRYQLLLLRRGRRGRGMTERSRDFEMKREKRGERRGGERIMRRRKARSHCCSPPPSPTPHTPWHHGAPAMQHFDPSLLIYHQRLIAAASHTATRMRSWDVAQDDEHTGFDLKLINYMNHYSAVYIYEKSCWRCTLKWK